MVALVMIVIRWCIPNMSQKLRDQIRREIYITNEIIIKQEALQASCAPCNEGENSSPRNAGDVINERLNRVIHNPLTNAEFDLEVHGSPVSPRSGHTTTV